ncbi:hypothetical protein QTP86_022131 [Hemibagrus guttatus]|nr:hypothetical protein QTP86_022131 [Hemibagrus guttatus]
MSSRDPVEELAEALRHALASAAGSATPASVSAAAAAVSSPPVYASPMAVPAPYSGAAEDCNGFLLQCSLTLEMQSHLYPDDRAKIAFIISRLDGKALRWAEPLWSQSNPMMSSLSAFTRHFREVFGRPEGDSSVGERLCRIKQGNLSVTEYALQFRTLAAASGWNEQALIATYRQGLDPQVRLHLAAHEDSMGLEKFIQLSIRFATRMQLCFEEQQSQPAASTAPAQLGPVSHPEPADDAMQLELSEVSSADRQWERQRRLAQSCCFYCGGSGHFVAKCPLRPARALVSSLFPTQNISKPLSVLVSLTTHDFCVSATALIDSGSAGNFISGALCRQLQLPTAATPKIYQVHAVTGKLLRQVRRQAGPLRLHIGVMHTEEIVLMVLEDSTVKLNGGSTLKVVLGRPWLEQHDPILSWRTGEILRWGHKCFEGCFPEQPNPRPSRPHALQVHATSVESPLEARSVNIPACYSHFWDVFCPKKASKLPPHRPWDCAIDLIPGEPVPKGRIYSLTLPEEKSMEEYIKEALAQGYICPSTSPAASSFFFVAKKDGGLRPCIDYRALNKMVRRTSGVCMDEKKVTAVRDWPTPTTVKELQRFLGFANFYRRFIRGYSSVTSPLTNLLRNKPKTLVWTPAATHAFQTLKQAFTIAPLLVHPDPELPFIVEVDASTTGVGAVLSQQQGNPRKLHPCAFFSRKLNPAEVNYDIGNRELLAVKLALEEWRHWLEGAKHPFTVLTDHKNLEYLWAAKRLNPRQARWALFFTRFKFAMSYRPGSKNVKADALSRIYGPDIASEDPEPVLPEKIFASPISWSEGMLPESGAPPGCPPGLQFIPRRTAPPSYTPRMSPWVLAIRGSRGPSRSSNNVSGGPAWQWMSRDTFRDAGSAPCLRVHVIFPPGSCCPFSFRIARGHT